MPAVDAGDVGRVWRLITKVSADLPREAQTFQSSVSIAYSVIAQQFRTRDANVLAAYLRATLIEVLRRRGVLAAWFEGNDLSQAVFDCVATFPLPNGVESFDPSRFLAALRQAGRRPADDQSD